MPKNRTLQPCLAERSTRNRFLRPSFSANRSAPFGPKPFVKPRLGRFLASRSLFPARFDMAFSGFSHRPTSYVGVSNPRRARINNLNGRACTRCLASRPMPEVPHTHAVGLHARPASGHRAWQAMYSEPEHGAPLPGFLRTPSATRVPGMGLQPPSQRPRRETQNQRKGGHAGVIGCES
jgi:hypothetical protein